MKHLASALVFAFAVACLSPCASAQQYKRGTHYWEFKGGPIYPYGYTKHVIPTGRVLVFRLTARLSSDHVRKGQLFLAHLDTANVGGDPVSVVNSLVLGHVDYVQAKTATTPGVLGVTFDELRKDDGYDFPLTGSLIAIGPHSVEKKDGRWVVKSTYRADNLMFVGSAPNGEPLARLVTRGNLVSDAMIAKAFGWDSAELQKHRSRYSDAFARTGTPYGILLTKDLVYYAPSKK
jgi:hypothetical protein